jgi:3-oxoacyl-[acyl-carrier-protein] synthase III
MSFFKFTGVSIKGISAIVPEKTVDNLDCSSDLLTKNEIRKYIKNVGVRFRHITDSNTTTADLCHRAADNLLEYLNTDRKEIDVLIFVTQTPDYILPATAVVLQNRLGLQKKCVAFDINLGCSGYINGLLNAFLFLQQDSINNVLLLCGDTSSKLVSKKDKSSALLFGDAGTATLIHRETSDNKSYFSLNSDGSGFEHLIVKGGGFRHIVTEKTVVPYIWPDENIRADNQLYMNGMEIFNFVIKEVCNDINNTLDYAGINKNNIDYFIFHQANQMLTNFIAKKLSLPSTPILTSLYQYGNTSSASIPLTICSKFGESTLNNQKLLLCGFGVGLSWATAILDINNGYILPIMEV